MEGCAPPHLYFWLSLRVVVLPTCFIKNYQGESRKGQGKIRFWALWHLCRPRSVPSTVAPGLGIPASPRLPLCPGPASDVKAPSAAPHPCPASRTPFLPGGTCPDFAENRRQQEEEVGLGAKPRPSPAHTCPAATCPRGGGTSRGVAPLAPHL